MLENMGKLLGNELSYSIQGSAKGHGGAAHRDRPGVINPRSGGLATG